MTKRAHREYGLDYIADKYKIDEKQAYKMCIDDMAVHKHYTFDDNRNILVTQVGLMAFGRKLKPKSTKVKPKKQKAITEKPEVKDKPKPKEIVQGVMCRNYPNPRVIGCAVKGKDGIIKVTNLKAVVNEHYYRGRTLTLEMTGEDTAVISGIANGRR